MEPAGLALGIVALYTTCRDCYSFFTTVKTAEAESSAHLRELEIQQSILKAWGFHWQIHCEDSMAANASDRDKKKRNKLQEYLLSNRFKAEGVFSTLSALADTLSNQEKLSKRYGIQLQPVQTAHGGSHSNNNVQLLIEDANIDDVKPVISELKNRLSFLNKCKWALKDRDNFKKLIADLRSHSESLYRLCPENAFESMNIYLAMECLARQESPTGLKFTSQLAIQQAAVDEQSSLKEGYELLAAAANLKASVNENREGQQVEPAALESLDEQTGDMFYLGKGLALFEDQVVYMEMRNYRGPPLELTPEQKQKIKELKQRMKRRLRREKHSRRRDSGDDDSDYSSSSEDGEDGEDELKSIQRVRPADPYARALIGNFFNTFHGASMRESVYGLDIAGMIDHKEGEHKGHCSILYKLPGKIGTQNRERPAGNLKLRAPVTLQSLLGSRYKEGIRSTLGARFELARKLVRAVCMLHSSGWLHKNIRAESVIFFPDHVSALQEDRYEVTADIDVSRPILMGYIFSRPDDIPTRLDPKPVPKREEEAQGMFYWDSGAELEISRKRNARTKGPYGRNMVSKAIEPEQTKETNISGFTLDYYQHPAKHADPRRLYRHAYDVYSLGILLLEVGLWEQIRIKNVSEDPDEEDHYERRRWICREYLHRLRWACGDTYADVVLSCLMIDSIDNEVADASERELCARIVADLESCRA